VTADAEEKIAVANKARLENPLPRIFDSTPSLTKNAKAHELNQKVLLSIIVMDMFDFNSLCAAPNSQVPICSSYGEHKNLI
jgi:hypothetical protein